MLILPCFSHQAAVIYSVGGGNENLTKNKARWLNLGKNFPRLNTMLHHSRSFAIGLVGVNAQGKICFPLSLGFELAFIHVTLKYLHLRLKVETPPP